MRTHKQINPITWATAGSHEENKTGPGVESQGVGIAAKAVDKARMRAGSLGTRGPHSPWVWSLSPATFISSSHPQVKLHLLQGACLGATSVPGFGCTGCRDLSRPTHLARIFRLHRLDLLLRDA